MSTIETSSISPLRTTRPSESAPSIPVSVSARHVHLTREHFEALFGAGRTMTWRSNLSQPGQFACQEQVKLVGPRASFDHVRILGPTRPASQVEISKTDALRLGIDVPVRASGDIEGSPGIGDRGAERFRATRAGCHLRRATYSHVARRRRAFQRRRQGRGQGAYSERCALAGVRERSCARASRFSPGYAHRHGRRQRLRHRSRGHGSNRRDAAGLTARRTAREHVATSSTVLPCRCGMEIAPGR